MSKIRESYNGSEIITEIAEETKIDQSIIKDIIYRFVNKIRLKSLTHKVYIYKLGSFSAFLKRRSGVNLLNKGLTSKNVVERNEDGTRFVTEKPKVDFKLASDYVDLIRDECKIKRGAGNKDLES
jgi:nucleoid DNA-binding protein